jgi:hypothetical protein
MRSNAAVMLPFLFNPDLANVTSLFYLGDARLLVLMSCLYLYYRLAYSHLPRT